MSSSIWDGGVVCCPQGQVQPSWPMDRPVPSFGARCRAMMLRLAPALAPAGGLHHLIEHAEEYGTILLSPTSRSSTWDMLRGGYGPGKGWEGNSERAHSQPGAARLVCSRCSLSC